MLVGRLGVVLSLCMHWGAWAHQLQTHTHKSQHTHLHMHLHAQVHVLLLPPPPPLPPQLVRIPMLTLKALPVSWHKLTWDKSPGTKTVRKITIQQHAHVSTSVLTIANRGWVCFVLRSAINNHMCLGVLLGGITCLTLLVKYGLMYIIRHYLSHAAKSICCIVHHCWRQYVLDG